MKPVICAGILVIVLGVFMIADEGKTCTERDKTGEIGSIEDTDEAHKTIHWPPILGRLAIAG